MSNSIRFLHLRDYEGFEGPIDREHDGAYLCLKGGKTIAYRVIDGVLEYLVARCGSQYNFNRKRGVQVAGGRLEKAAIRPKCAARVKKVELEEGDKAIEVLVELEG